MHWLFLSHYVKSGAKLTKIKIRTDIFKYFTQSRIEICLRFWKKYFAIEQTKMIINLIYK